jgi:TonB family protein
VSGWVARMGSRVLTRAFAAGANLAFVCTLASHAGAQSVTGVPKAAPSGAISLTPPKALAPGVVPYPRGAQGAAAVVVELVIDSDGSVSEVRLVEGAARFVEVTMEAARHWRFEPARRGDDVIAARVRMRVDFTPPWSSPPPRLRPGP